MIVMQVFNWKFRVLGNGTMESKNVSKQMDWAVRSATECGLDTSRYWFIMNTISQAARVFPDEPVPPPSSEAPEAADQQIREKIVAAESQPV